MDFKEKYQEALERAKKGLPIDEVFPELKESEDERMSNIILEGFKNYSRSFSEWNDVPVERVIAYLEKQEQNSNDVKREWWNKGYLEGRKNAHIPARELGLPSSWDFQKEQKPTPDWMPKFLDELRSKENYFDWDGHRDIEGHILAIINWIDPNYFDRKEKEQKSLSPDEKMNHPLYLEGFDVGREVGKVEAEQKPAEWSEEDADIIRNLQEFLEQYGDEYYGTIAKAETIHWLKSLPINLKKKNEDVTKLCSNEWSEEDEKMCQHIISDLREFRDCETDEELISDYEDEISWLKNRLKSLRPQPHWKPSGEQMDALEHFIRSWGESGTMSPQNPTLCAAKTLLNDLKKL